MVKALWQYLFYYQFEQKRCLLSYSTAAMRRRMDLSLRSLEEAVSIRRQIDNLERRLNSIVGGSAARAMTRDGRAGRRRMTAATRANLAAAARARWARQKAGGKMSRATTRRKRSGISAAGRRRLSQLMKARWAAR